MTQVLVVGLGNIFAGDAGFGVVVARRMAARPQPPDVHVLDLGDRAAELAPALQDQYDAAVLINVMSRGGEPGTLYLADPDPGPDLEPTDAPTAHDAAGASIPGIALVGDFGPSELQQLLGTSPGRRCRRIMVVGCEPETLGDPHVGTLGLSALVSEAADRAVELVERVASRLAGHS